MIDVRARIRTRIAEDPLDHVGRHLLQEIRGIVRHQVIDDARCFTVGHGVDNILLIVKFQIRKYICRHGLGQDPEDLEGLLILHIVHDRCDIRCLHIRTGLPQLCILP